MVVWCCSIFGIQLDVENAKNFRFVFLFVYVSVEGVVFTISIFYLWTEKQKVCAWKLFSVDIFQGGVKGVVLVGGPSKGTRFRPLSLDIAKPLFPIAGNPLIYHHLEACTQLKNLKEVSFVTITLYFSYHSLQRSFLLAFMTLPINNGKNSWRLHEINWESQ
jgi:hypothetical protein